MPPRSRRVQTQSTRIPIHSLSGGVGRQAPSKRLPIEAETMDNVLVTLERSFEKRSGFEMITDDTDLQVALGDAETGIDYAFFWFLINAKNRYLLRLRFETTSTVDNLLKIWRVDTTGAKPYWEAVESGEITVDPITLDYLTHNPDDLPSKECLKTVPFGTQLIILNTQVAAGFTSEENAAGNFFTYALNGDITTTSDIIGQKISYHTSTGYDKSVMPYDPIPTADTIPIEDLTKNVFPTDPQSVTDFSEIPFPPDTNEGNSVSDFNLFNWQRYPYDTGTEQDQTTRRVIAELHDAETPYYDDYPNAWVEFYDEGGAGFPIRRRFPSGLGKIYHAQASYLTQPPGYYRIISFETNRTITMGDGGHLPNHVYNAESGGALTPFIYNGKGRSYTQRLRTPDALSVIDKKRMPQSIKLEKDGSAPDWRAAPIEWEPRRSGDSLNNPGPSIFYDRADKHARQVKLNAIASFRGRLWFAAEDVMFSSRLGDAADLWIRDPGIIGAADPIDVRASSDTFAEITAMIPFNTFMFVNTKGDRQFELIGSENQITPQTAELNPTTFYSTDPLVNPVLLGSQIYFFAPERLYLYFADSQQSINTAVEVSQHCNNYLPEAVKSVAVSAAQDTIIAIDESTPNDIYLYTNRFAGDQVSQSAFYRFIIPPQHAAQSLAAWENNLYAVTLKHDGVSRKHWLSRCYLRLEDELVPRIDMHYTLTLKGD